jgi:hypothetical protein
LNNTLDEGLNSLTTVLKGAALGLKKLANFLPSVLGYPANPTSTLHSHAPEIPEEQGDLAAGNHWLHDPGKSADTDYFHGVTDYFQVYFSGNCRFLLSL